MTEDEKQAKLDEARRLLDEVNDAERDDPELNWRPWGLSRGTTQWGP